MGPAHVGLLGTCLCRNSKNIAVALWSNDDFLSHLDRHTSHREGSVQAEVPAKAVVFALWRAIYRDVESEGEERSGSESAALVCGTA